MGTGLRQPVRPTSTTVIPGTYDVAIVGGGPAGSEVARQTARAGLRTIIFEEHHQAGQPVQCTGLVAAKPMDRIRGPGIELQRYRGAVAHAPGGRTLGVMAAATRVHLIDRGRLDLQLFAAAAAAGAETRLGQRVETVTRTPGGVMLRARGPLGRSEVTAKVLVSAEGVQAFHAHRLGLKRSRTVLAGLQVELAIRLDDPDRVRLYVGERVAPGYFAWAVPNGDRTLLGLATDRGDIRAHLKYLRQRPEFKGAGVVRMLSGAIPIGRVKVPYADRLAAVGDAAGLAKPLSGGGLYTGLVSADCLAVTLIEATAVDRFDANQLAGYGTRLRETGIPTELDLADGLRRIYARFSDRRIDDLFATFDNPDFLSLVEESGDIDFPTRLIVPILRRAPQLVKLAPQLLKALL